MMTGSEAMSPSDGEDVRPSDVEEARPPNVVAKIRAKKMTKMRSFFVRAVHELSRKGSQ